MSLNIEVVKGSQGPEYFGYIEDRDNGRRYVCHAFSEEECKRMIENIHKCVERLGYVVEIESELLNGTAYPVHVRRTYDKIRDVITKNVDTPKVPDPEIMEGMLRQYIDASSGRKAYIMKRKEKTSE